MIKLVYKQKNYDYKNVGGQPYDIGVEIELNEDANLTQAIAAFVRLLQIAGYRCATEDHLKKALDEYFNIDYYH